LFGLKTNHLFIIGNVLHSENRAAS
jgi:hypothetical protein